MSNTVFIIEKQSKAHQPSDPDLPYNFTADLDPRFIKMPGQADHIDPARRTVDSGLPLYDAEPSKLTDISGEAKYVITIAAATLRNVQSHNDSVKNSKMDAAFRSDQVVMAETQFAYMQTTTLQDRHHPRRYIY